MAELLLGALWLLVADEARDAAKVPVAGAETAGASNDATAASLELGTATSAAIVETGPEEIAWTSGAAASTTVD